MTTTLDDHHPAARKWLDQMYDQYNRQRNPLDIMPSWQQFLLDQTHEPLVRIKAIPGVSYRFELEFKSPEYLTYFLIQYS